ncbi:MAG TPA: BamA/TamA family outer membrane protein, partial [Gammaproteobacteria bacterium]
ADAIAIGEKAGDGQRADLDALVTRANLAAAASPARRVAPAAPPVVGFLRLDADTAIGEGPLLHPFHGLVGKPLDTARLEAAIEELYGWNIFESVRYELIREGGQDGLLIRVKEKTWGPNYLQFGVALSSDMDGDGEWNIGGSMLKTALNEWAGEARFAAQIGESPLVFVEFYQPLGDSLRWFGNVRALYDSRSFGRFEGNDVLEEYRVHRYGGDVSFGRTIADWGEARVGLRRFSGDAEIRVGDPATPEVDFDNFELYGKITYDTLDNRNFPHSGALASLEWIEATEDLGGDDDFTQLLAHAAGAYTWDRNTLFGGVQFDYTADHEAPIQNRFRVGGFTRLSGFALDEISGQQVLLLRSGYYRRLDVKLLPVYVGMSLEYGNAYEERDDITLDPDEAILAASVFLGMDTILGPVYLSYGHAEAGNDSVYLFLGRLF